MEPIRPTDPRRDPHRVEFYEGLVRKTASRYVGIVQEDYEDLCQILRLKCWRALESFDPAKASQPVQGYVFSCVRNQVKDLLKRKRRNDLYIEDIAPKGKIDGEVGLRDSFEARYLRSDEERAFAEVLGDTPLIPSTLTTRERTVLVCLYLEYGHTDIAESLDLTKRDVSRAVKGIREKMADWKPSAKARSNGNGANPTTKEGNHIGSGQEAPEAV